MVTYMVGDYKVCIEEATAFLHIAQSCVGDAGEFLLGQMYPFAVNCSLSCELYIKAIMIHNSQNGEFKKGHNLNDLFESMDAVDQNAITSIYAHKCTKPLSELLTESGDAFIDWRYALEKGVTICVSGILALPQSLAEYTSHFK